MANEILSTAGRPAVPAPDALSLLARAAGLYDADGRLQTTIRQAGGGFRSGVEWMSRALTVIRGQPPAPAPQPRCAQTLGIVKYGLASGAALLWVAGALFVNVYLIPLAILVFYAVEAQMVFLFPLVLDGSVRPFRDARRWTRRAGGTLAVMRAVLPLACAMLCGGFFGRGFVRCWCLGCLAVCLWYEDLRLAE